MGTARPLALEMYEGGADNLGDRPPLPDRGQLIDANDNDDAFLIGE